MPALSDLGLGAVCCHFNPCRYRARVDNYRRFRRALAKSAIPLLTVELAFGDEPFDVEADPYVLQIRGGDVMFQKERLWQIGAERLLDDGFESIVFLDADVLFAESEWPRQVAEALESAPVVQCFSHSTAEYTDADVEQVGGVRRFRERGTLDGRHGLAWALRADLLARVELYQHCVVGGGDTALLCGALGLAGEDDFRALGLPLPHALRYSGAEALAHFGDWARRFAAASGGVTTDVDLRLRALAHGALASRDYRGRHRLLAGFDPGREVTSAPGGPLAWTPAGEPRRQPVADYFRSRDEDVVATAGGAR
ncbi:MAG: hypothetical protein ACHQ4J_10955 [Candidatus Binatia bacterium]